MIPVRPAGNDNGRNNQQCTYQGEFKVVQWYGSTSGEEKELEKKKKAKEKNKEKAESSN